MKDKTHEECMGTQAIIGNGYISCVRYKDKLTEQERRYLEWKEKRDREREQGSDKE